MLGRSLGVGVVGRRRSLIDHHASRESLEGRCEERLRELTTEIGRVRVVALGSNQIDRLSSSLRSGVPPAHRLCHRLS